MDDPFSVLSIDLSFLHLSDYFDLKEKRSFLFRKLLFVEWTRELSNQFVENFAAIDDFANQRQAMIR